MYQKWKIKSLWALKSLCRLNFSLSLWRCSLVHCSELQISDESNQFWWAQEWVRMRQLRVNTWQPVCQILAISQNSWKAKIWISNNICSIRHTQHVYIELPGNACTKDANTAKGVGRLPRHCADVKTCESLCEYYLNCNAKLLWYTSAKRSSPASPKVRCPSKQWSYRRQMLHEDMLGTDDKVKRLESGCVLSIDFKALSQPWVECKQLHAEAQHFPLSPWGFVVLFEDPKTQCGWEPDQDGQEKQTEWWLFLPMPLQPKYVWIWICLSRLLTLKQSEN